jgi:selenocysteine-specific elongation factor
VTRGSHAVVAEPILRFGLVQALARVAHRPFESEGILDATRFTQHAPPMLARHYILATAGHVDHGKSALVKVLTGTDPDRLPEEKARGITIDLGFAHLELPAPSHLSPLPSHLSLGIVDVPGHEDFVKNMVAGVGSIDLALFIVAADDGWMPQTEEHLQILTYLGVRHAVVALTKIDLCEGDESVIIVRIREQLCDTPFSNVLIVPTSVVTGRGIEELKSALATTLAAVPPPADVSKPRLPIDRVFTLHGIGTVVTGTLIGGVLRRNQPVLIQPLGKATRIRSLQSHNRDAEAIGPGTRTALNLPDLPSAASAPDGVARGEVVTVAELGAASDTLDVLLEKSPRLAGTKNPAARPLKDRTLVRIHHGSGNLPARVLLLDNAPIEAGGRALAQLHFDQPIFALGGDRFIVRDWAEQCTLGGGLVLEADASRKDFRSESRREWLAHRAAAPDDLQIWIATELACRHAVRRAALLLKTRFSATQIAAALTQLAAEGNALLAGDWAADAGWWKQLRRKAAEAVQAEHRARPERLGLALNELRAAVEPDLPAPEVFDALLADLCGAEFVQTATTIHHVSHRPALPPKLQAAGAKLRAALGAKPFEPPAKKDLAPDPLAQQALRFLVETGEAIEVGPELTMLTEHFVKAREAIRKFIHERGTASASDLRQLLNTNRRVIIPLLERLDKDAVTQRRGDVRVLK